MNDRTRQQLVAINRDFYEREADSFSATRDHAWPGWERVVAEGPAKSVLDVGCGNGRFARFLQGIEDVQRYQGVDTSSALIEAARKQTPQVDGLDVSFEVADALAAPAGPFDLIVVFGLMHHVPGLEHRVAMLTTLASRLAPGGRLAATFWRFGADPRFEGRLQAWDAAIDVQDLEPGDHLLRWGESEGVARYCHFADDAELEALVARMAEHGAPLVDRFRSDGRGGALNEYLVWRRS